MAMLHPVSPRTSRSVSQWLLNGLWVGSKVWLKNVEGVQMPIQHDEQCARSHRKIKTRVLTCGACIYCRLHAASNAAPSKEKLHAGAAIISRSRTSSI